MWSLYRHGKSSTVCRHRSAVSRIMSSWSLGIALLHWTDVLTYMARLSTACNLKSIVQYGDFFDSLPTSPRKNSEEEELNTIPSCMPWKESCVSLFSHQLYLSQSNYSMPFDWKYFHWKSEVILNISDGSSWYSIFVALTFDSHEA